MLEDVTIGIAIFLAFAFLAWVGRHFQQVPGSTHLDIWSSVS